MAGTIVPVDGSQQLASREQLPTEVCPWCGTAISRAKFIEIEARIHEQERKKLDDARADLRRQFAAQLQSVQKKAQQAADRRVNAYQEGSERKHQEELKKLRKVLAQIQDQAILKKEAEFNREREAYQKKVKELERKLQQRTANDLGDGAEIDLYDTLREAFPRDSITPIAKGHPGGDILHEILHKGEPVGKILIDSKNRQIWQNGFVTKLRADQLAAKADHAILATTVFPAGKKELLIEGNIIVVSPARVVQIITLLREAAVKMHLLGLSTKERATKMARLYKFMTSEDYARLFGEAGKLTQEILNLDVEEKREHDNVWKKRGATVTQLKNVLHDIDTEVTAILEGSSAEE